MANKVISQPICFALYEVPDNIFEIVGSQIDRPSLVVIEAMVEQGLARRIKILSSTIHEEEDEEVEEDEAEGQEKPWYPKE